MMKRLVMGSLAAMAIATVGNAATVSFNEGDSGDAGNFLNSATDLGTLTNAGDVSTAVGGTDVDNGDKFDVFSFSSALDFSVSVTSLSVSSGNSTWKLFASDGSDTGAFSSTADGFTGSILGGRQSAGSYFLRFAENTGGVVASYDFAITALPRPTIRTLSNPNAAVPPPPVPLPAGLPLMIGGIGALAWLRRRKRA